jgi:hypothetical protein
VQKALNLEWCPFFEDNCRKDVHAKDLVRFHDSHAPFQCLAGWLYLPPQRYRLCESSLAPCNVRSLR